MNSLQNTEVIDPSKISWKPIEEFPKGAWIKTLHVNDETGAMAAIVKFDKGFREPKHKHPSNHHIIVLDGKLVDDKGNEIKRGMYFFTPAGVEHGPLDAPEDCVFYVYFDGPAF